MLIPVLADGDTIYEDENDSYNIRVENANYTECAAEMQRFYERLGTGWLRV